MRVLKKNLKSVFEMIYIGSQVAQDFYGKVGKLILVL